MTDRKYTISVTEARTDYGEEWEPATPAEKVYSGTDMNWMGTLMWLAGFAFGLSVGGMLL